MQKKAPAPTSLTRFSVLNPGYNPPVNAFSECSATVLSRTIPDSSVMASRPYTRQHVDGQGPDIDCIVRHFDKVFRTLTCTGAFDGPVARRRQLAAPSAARVAAWTTRPSRAVGACLQPTPRPAAKHTTCEQQLRRVASGRRRREAAPEAREAGKGGGDLACP